MINLFGLNGRQLMAGSLAILGALMVANTQLTDLFGPTLAKSIGSAAGLLNLMLGSALMAVTGQGSDIKNVLNMPGVESIKVNEKANQTLAVMAVDPLENKIAPTISAMNAVNNTAKGV